MAAVGATEENRQLVADQFAAAVSEDGWPIDQARSVLLVAPGREPSDAATLRGHGVANRLAVRASRVAALQTERVSVSREAGVGKVSEGRVEGAPWRSLENQNWPFRGLGKHLALQTPLTIPFSGGQVYIIGGARSP